MDFEIDPELREDLAKREVVEEATPLPSLVQ